MWKKILVLLAMVIFAAVSAPRGGQASTLTEGAGWSGDNFNTGVPLTYDFSLSGNGIFSLSDCCVAGDVYSITGSFLGASTFGLAPIAITLGLGNTFFDSYWTDSTFSHFQIALGQGSYSISVTGDCTGGCPSGVGVRVDLATVPLPAAGFLLVGALGGMRLLARRRGRKSV